ncbi:MAG: peptidoglycan-binding domain-containing protein [Veillonella parvula]
MKNFQIEYGLPVSGIVDWQTEAYLNSTNINIVRAGLQRHGYKFSSSSGRYTRCCCSYI